MADLYAISRIEFYKLGDVNKVYGEAVRGLEHYKNKDINLELSKYNVDLIDRIIFDDFEQFLRIYKKEHNVKGRLQLKGDESRQTNVMCQVLFSGSKDLILSMDRSEQISYYKNCLSWFIKENPTIDILSATIHYDEKAVPHLQVNFLPLVYKNDKLIFSTTELFKGRDCFNKYQDSFFDFSHSYFIDRNIDTKRRREGAEELEHLDTYQYKELMRQLEEENRKLTAAKNEYEDYVRGIDKLKKLYSFYYEEFQKLMREIKSTGLMPSLEVKLENSKLRKELGRFKKFFNYIKVKNPNIIKDYNNNLHNNNEKII